MSESGSGVSESLRQTSQVLRQARHSGLALSGLPEGMPETLEEAYALQDYSIGQWDDTVAGWKIGGVPPSYLDRCDDKFLVGPVFAKSVQLAPDGGCVAMPIFAGGFAAIEPEFIFQLGEGGVEDRLFIGAEIASSPVPDLNSYGPCAIVGDFGNNCGILVGPEVEDWRSRTDPLTMTTYIDGQEIGSKTLPDYLASAHVFLAFLREKAKQRDIALPPGTYVSSGAITGVHEAAVGARSTLDFADLGTVELELVAK